MLRLSLPDGVRYLTNDFREDLARTNTLPSAFFNYDETTGKPIRQEKGAGERRVLPAIRIVGGKTWVGILAEETAVSLLQQAALPALRVTAQKCAGPIEAKEEVHRLELVETQSLRPYFIREMVIRKGWRKDMPEDEVKALVTRRLISAIVDQAEIYGIDIPPDDRIDLVVTDVLRPRGLRIIGANGDTGTCATLLDVKFSSNLMLNGFWFAGNLTARGYGRIGPRFAEMWPNRRSQEAA